jgi:hypothetical protein
MLMFLDLLARALFCSWQLKSFANFPRNLPSTFTSMILSRSFVPSSHLLRWARERA